MTDGPAQLYDERLEVTRNRYMEARKAGLTIVEAQLFADSDADIALLRKLVKGKATVEQIRRIVL